jgi:hypothetical protein
MESKQLLYLLGNELMCEFRDDESRRKLTLLMIRYWGLLNKESSSVIQKKMAPFIKTDKRTPFEKEMMKKVKIQIVQDDMANPT